LSQAHAGRSRFRLRRGGADAPTVRRLTRIPPCGSLSLGGSLWRRGSKSGLWNHS